jgi:alpha-amylase
MNKVTLLLAVHNHQPSGNFGSVFERAYETAYRPFLEALERHPTIRISLHVSGCLWDWILANRRDYVARIQKLVFARQVELLSGGYYEPILQAIPKTDAQGQVHMMNAFLYDTFGVRPTGFWCTERIWEPNLPDIVGGTGLKYTLVDDYHFLSAVPSPEDLVGYFMTDYNGTPLSVFPISEKLRYFIPFKEPEATLDLLRSYAETGRNPAVVFGDDGEKLGVWPGTAKWVYEDGWLDRFIAALDANRDWIDIVPLGEYLDTHHPTGEVFLPTNSYRELGEWALFPGAQREYRESREALQARPPGPNWQRYWRGGFYRNFLSKYSEGNWMQKRMLYVSGKVGGMWDGEAKRRALRSLYEAQCNCAYWHGVFGGLYLNYLRDAVYHHLLTAEKAAVGDGPTEPETVDVDKDGRNEIVLRNRAFTVIAAPHRGGTVAEIDVRPYDFHLTDALTRRYESYHDLVKRVSVRGNPGHSSIHEAVRSKDPGLFYYLVYDRRIRASFREYVVDASTDVDCFRVDDFADHGGFADAEFDPAISGNSITLASLTPVHPGDEKPSLTKTVDLSVDDRVSFSYRMNGASLAGESLALASEFNLTLLASRDADRYIELADGARFGMMHEGVLPGVKGFRIVDEWRKMTLAFEFDRVIHVAVYPVETVSQSEDGFERTYQNTAFLFLFPLDLTAEVALDTMFILKLEG